MIEKIEDVHTKVALRARSRMFGRSMPRRALEDVVNHVEKIV